MKSKTSFILTLGVVTTLLFMGRTIIVPTLPLYARIFNASDAMIGGLVAAYGAARLALDIPAGSVASRRNPKKWLLIGLSIVIVANIVAAFAVNYWMLLVTRILEGAGTSIYSVNALTLIGQATELRKRGRTMAGYIMMIDIGTMLGPLFGGFSAEAFGLTAPFYLYALAVGGAAVWTLFVLKIPEDIEASPERSERHAPINEVFNLIRNRHVVFVSFATLSLFFTRGAITQTAVPIFAFDNLNVSKASAGILLAVIHVSSLFTTAPSGALTDRVGRKPMTLLAIVSTAVVVFAIPFSQTVEVLMALMLLYGITLGLSGPNSAWFIDVSPPQMRGTAMGLYRLGNDFGLFIGPAVAGFLIGVSKSPDGRVQPLAFMVTSAFLILSFLIATRASDPVRSQRLSARKGQDK